jgi:hypothetical protein
MTRSLYLEYIRSSKISVATKETNNKTQFKIGKDSKQHCFKEEIQMTNRNMKNCPGSQITSEIPIRTRMAYLLSYIKMINIKEEQNRGPDTNSHSYTHLIFDKGTKSI